MTRVLVHLHLYYQEMWPELKNRLKNITDDFDLFVSMIHPGEQIEKDILNFKPGAIIKIVENRGFDIASFLSVINSVDLDQYDYVIKLHTKRNLPLGTIRNGYDVSGDKWRRYLLSFLQAPETYNKSKSAFENDEELGMIGDFRLICKKDKSNKDAVARAMNLLENMGFEKRQFAYVMGTMFMVRANLLPPLQKININADQFNPSKHRTDDVLPYAYERVFGYLITAQGHVLKDILSSPPKQLAYRISSLIRNFIWRRKIKSDGTIIVKFCKIIVFRKKLQEAGNVK